jgi:hypothetical protein
MSVGRIRLTAVVDCARCARRAILDAADARRGAVAAQRAGWAKQHGRWHCPLCLAQLNGLAPPQAIKNRIEETVSALPTEDLALLHGAVVAELRRHHRPGVSYVP